MTEKEKMLKIIDREIEITDHFERMGGIRRDPIAILEYIKTCLSDPEKESILKEPSRPATQRQVIEKNVISDLGNILFGFVLAFGFMAILNGLCNGLCK